MVGQAVHIPAQDWQPQFDGCHCTASAAACLPAQQARRTPCLPCSMSLRLGDGRHHQVRQGWCPSTRVWPARPGHRTVTSCCRHPAQSLPLPLEGDLTPGSLTGMHHGAHSSGEAKVALPQLRGQHHAEPGPQAQICNGAGPAGWEQVVGCGNNSSRSAGQSASTSLNQAQPLAPN